MDRQGQAGSHWKTTAANSDDGRSRSCHRNDGNPIDLAVDQGPSCHESWGGIAGQLHARRLSHWTQRVGGRRCDLSRYKPDILGSGLDVIFCGLNPGASAARAGHNFSNQSNRFWTVLHLAGFTDFQLQPQDERRLLEYGCGITAVVSRPTKRADEGSPAEFLKARGGFETKNRGYTPRS